MVSLITTRTGYRYKNNQSSLEIYNNPDNVEGGSDIYVQSGYAGVLKFDNTIANILRSELGGVTASSWNQIEITNVTLYLQNRDTMPANQYTFAASPTLLSESHGEIILPNDSPHSDYLSISNNTSGANSTFNLTSFFKKFTDSYALKVNVNPWYLYIRTQMTSSADKRFMKLKEYQSKLEITAKLSSSYNGSGIKYYDGSSWKTVIPKYYDGSGWKDCSVKYYDGSGWKTIT